MKKVNIRNIHWLPEKTDLFVGPHQHNPGFEDKTRFTLHVPQINAFFEPKCEQNTVPQIWILFFWHFLKRKTWMVVSMNETSSAPKGMKCWVVCVFKVFLTIYPRPAVRSRSNTEGRAYNANLVFTHATRYNLILQCNTDIYQWLGRRTDRQ